MFFGITIYLTVFSISVLKCTGFQISDSDGINNACLIPEINNGKLDIPTGKVIYAPGDPPPNFPVIASCYNNKKYVLNTTYSVVYCLNGQFENNLPKCVLACPARSSTDTVDVICKLNGVERDCSKQVPEGTTATMECKPNYKELIPMGPSKATCLNGLWDRPLKQCVLSLECGELISKEQQIIVNGTEVRRGEFPWHAVIYRHEYINNYQCDGSIISDKFVLSASYCFIFDNGEFYPVNEFTVAAGIFFSNWDAPEDARFVQKRNISKIEFSKDKDFRFKFIYAGNIAIVILEKPFILTNFIKPVCVDWNLEYVNPQFKGGAIGQMPNWKDENTLEPEENSVLVQSTFSVVDINQCLKSTEVMQSVEDKFCAAYTNKKRPCIRSYGKSLVYPHDKLGKTIYYIHGIEFISIEDNNYCSKTLFTKVASYISFIRNVTNF